jgi:plastocyanin
LSILAGGGVRSSARFVALAVTCAALLWAGCGGSSNGAERATVRPTEVAPTPADTPSRTLTTAPSPSAATASPETATATPASATATPVAPEPTTTPTPSQAPATQHPATATAPPPPTPTATPRPQGGSVTVVVTDNAYGPRTIRVGAGGTVTWTWRGEALHDVTGAFGASPLQRSGTFSVTFSSPGTFAYACSVHLEVGMRGTVIVE